MTKNEFIQRVCISLVPQAIVAKITRLDTGKGMLSFEYGSQQIVDDVFLLAQKLEERAKEEGLEGFFDDEQAAEPKPEPESELNEDGRLIANYCPGYTPTTGLNTLDYFGITTIGQLTKISKKSIRRLPHIGQKTLRALDEMMKSLGLSFGRHYIKAYYKKQPNDENTMPFYRFSHIELTVNPEEASYYITNDIIWDDDKDKHRDLYFID